jgi:phosphomethylpyrimidine synthase
MKITQELRAAAEAGMQEKAREFRESGGEIYRKQAQVPANSGDWAVPQRR